MAETNVVEGSPYERPVMFGILALMIVFLFRYMARFNGEGLKVSRAPLYLHFVSLFDLWSPHASARSPSWLSFAQKPFCSAVNETIASLGSKIQIR